MLVQATAEYGLTGNIMFINIVSDVSAGYAEYVLAGNEMNRALGHLCAHIG